jgi:hypothetical protein
LSLIQRHRDTRIHCRGLGLEVLLKQFFQIPPDLVVSKYSIIPLCPSEKTKLSPKS